MGGTDGGLLSRLFEEAIAPYAEEIERLMKTSASQVVTVVVEPPLLAVQGGLARMGWDGTTAVFALSESWQEHLAKNCEAQRDFLTTQWLRSCRTGRLLVCSERGTLWVNFTPGHGHVLERSCTAAEFQAVLSPSER